MGQCSVFVRNREQLAGPPVELTFDETSVEWLAQMISAWTVGGLMQTCGAGQAAVSAAGHRA